MDQWVDGQSGWMNRSIDGETDDKHKLTDK